MRGIIKAEFRRLIKNKVSWIFLIVTLGAVFITTGTNAMMNFLAEENDFLAGIFGVSNYESLFSSIFNSDLIILVVAIMAVLYASQPYRSGFIKTISHHLKPRYKLIIPEYICIFTYSAVVTFITGIFVFVLGGLMFENLFSTITVQLIFKLIGYVACHALMLGVCACLVTGITNVLQNTALTLVTSLLYAAGFGTIIYQLITLLLQKIELCGSEFVLSDYTVIGNIYGVSMSGFGENVIRLIIVSVVVLTLSGFLSSVMLEKKDIK